MPLMMACWIGNALVAYAIGANAGRPLIPASPGERRFERMEHAVEEGGVTLLLAVRLIPIVPFSLFSIAAGAAKVPLWRFVWTTFVGYLPITVIFVYLGSQLEELSPTDPILWASAVALIAMMLGVRLPAAADRGLSQAVLRRPGTRRGPRGPSCGSAGSGPAVPGSSPGRPAPGAPTCASGTSRRGRR